MRKRRERTNNAFEAAAQLSFEDIAADAEEPAAETFEEPAAEPAAEAAPEPETADAAAYENVIRDEQEEPAAKEEPKEEKPFDFDQARYDGSFNRAYADYTEKQEAERERPYESYRAATPPPSYYAAPRTYGQSAAQQPAAPYYDTPATAGYVPDAFLNGLNAAERDEFTKLFISRIYGENKRLPGLYRGRRQQRILRQDLRVHGQIPQRHFGRTARKDLRIQQSHPLKKMQPPLFRTEERRFSFARARKFFIPCAAAAQGTPRPLRISRKTDGGKNHAERLPCRTAMCCRKFPKKEKYTQK